MRYVSRAQRLDGRGGRGRKLRANVADPPERRTGYGAGEKGSRARGQQAGPAGGAWLRGRGGETGTAGPDRERRGTKASGEGRNRR